MLFVAIFAIAMGVVLPAFWACALKRHLVPESAEGSREIRFHIAAEVTTGALLASGGIWLLADSRSRWALAVLSAGAGMLVYTLIQSPGYYVERHARGMLIFFAAIWVITVGAFISAAFSVIR